MISLRRIELADLEEYKFWKYPQHRYHLTNGPYFPKGSKKQVDAFIEEIRLLLKDGMDDPIPNKRIISSEKSNMLGEVNWYWRSPETLWLEIGIVIFDDKNWGKGIGFQALKLWIDHVFKIRPKIVRLGLSTWSGNIGMIQLAKKLNMKKEAEYRKARIVKGKYYDSVSYGILREEWEKRNM